MLSREKKNVRFLRFVFTAGLIYNFINDTFFQASVTPKVKKNRKSTVLNWTTSRLKIPTGHVTNLSFHVSIRTKVSNGQTSKNVIMDITAIGPNASVSTYGECD